MVEIDEKKFKTALNEVAATDSGKILIAALKESCQWEQTYLSSDSPEVSHYHAVKRGIYGGLRKNIKREYLIDIEFNYKWIKINERNDTRSSTRAKPSERGASKSR